ncbi:MAG: sigma-70 family RNA polymerase sigma factor [Ruminococcus sp.]|nr:sigma-70 family RNA polymerase sigma factor [Ruminococcus sp.]MCD7800860.1 sigma-70 family RNA polymerase sigma factor [Ruminococcus sp.]
MAKNKRVDIFNDYHLDEEINKTYFNNLHSSGGSLDKARSKMYQVMKDELNENQAQVLKMYYFDNLKQKDIARLLQKDQSTVSRTLKRAKNNLAKILKYFI